MFTNISKDASIAVMGHSLGGSSSIEACRHISKIKKAINLDGRVINPSDVTVPVFQMIAKKTKEDRTLYNNALAELSKTNSGLVQKELNIGHSDFSSPDLADQIVEECINFLK